MAHALVEQLTAELAELGDPQRARDEAAYLKSDLTFFGVRLPVVRSLVQRTFRPVHDRADVLGFAATLWDARPPVFEPRIAAVLLLVEAVPLLVREDLDLVVRFVRESQTWALVDALACEVAGPLVERLEAAGADLTPVLDAWAGDDDFWLRRTALLAHLRPLKQAGDWPRFTRYADAMLDEKEFFIQKAIGWVLRDTGKRRPDLVRPWVEPRLGRMSGVTRREAVKYLAIGEDPIGEHR